MATRMVRMAVFMVVLLLLMPMVLLVMIWCY